MDVALVIAFLAFIGWRERMHAVERAQLLSRRSVAPPAVLSRRRGKTQPPRVIAADDDAAFSAYKDRTEEPREGVEA